MERLLKEVKEQLESIKEALAFGACKDMSEYSFICGQARMLRQFQDYLINAIENQQKLEENEDA